MSFYDDHVGIARDIKGIEERLEELEKWRTSKLPTAEEVKGIFKNIKPAEEPSVIMTTAELQDIAERYEVELRRMLDFMETQILYEFAEHQKRVNGNAEIESVKYFLKWISKWSRYEIKRKKKK